MRNKVYIAAMSLVFIFFLLYCPITLALEKLDVIQLEDRGNYKDPEKVYDKDVFLSGLLNGIEQGKADLNNIYTNYLPFYNDILDAVNNAEYTMYENFVLFLTPSDKDNNPPSNNPDNTDNTSDDDTPPPRKTYSSVYVSEDNVFKTYSVPELGFLETAVNKTEAEMYSDMLGELAHVNRIAAASTNVNFYVYVGTRMQDTEYYNDIIPNELCTYDMFQEFVNGIKGADGVAYFDIDTVEKRLERGFKTDHHWKAAGVYSGYLQILDMMKKQTPDIGEPLELKGYINIPGYEYRGFWSRRTLFDRYYDNLQVYDVDLVTPDRNNGYQFYLDSYLKGEVSKNKYTAHYESMFTQSEKIFYSANKTGRNLLIIGDSFTYWLQPLLSTHFDKTYFHKTISETTIDYNKFIEENGITDVLLIQWSGRMLFKASNIPLFLEQVITR